MDFCFGSLVALRENLELEVRSAARGMTLSSGLLHFVIGARKFHKSNPKKDSSYFVLVRSNTVITVENIIFVQ